jgi:hypothetical protein
MATTTTALSEQEVRARIARGRPLALGLGILGLIVWASGLATNPKLALQGYHLAFFYWMGLSLGCLGFALLLHTVRARFGLPLDSHLRVGRTANRPADGSRLPAHPVRCVRDPRHLRVDA